MKLPILFDLTVDYYLLSISGFSLSDQTADLHFRIIRLASVDCRSLTIAR